jgi:hypothetical protein
MFGKRSILYCCKGSFFFILPNKTILKALSRPSMNDLKRHQTDFILIDHNSGATKPDEISPLVTDSHHITVCIIVSLGASGFYWKFPQSTRHILKFALYGWSLFEIQVAAQVCPHLSIIQRSWNTFLTLYQLRGGSLRAILRDLRATPNIPSSLLTSPIEQSPDLTELSRASIIEDLNK